VFHSSPTNRPERERKRQCVKTLLLLAFVVLLVVQLWMALEMRQMKLMIAQRQDKTHEP